MDDVEDSIPSKEANIGRQLALNYMINSLSDYARKHGLKFPTIDKELLSDTI